VVFAAFSPVGTYSFEPSGVTANWSTP